MSLIHARIRVRHPSPPPLLTLHTLLPRRSLCPHLQLLNLLLQSQPLRNQPTSLFLELCNFLCRCCFTMFLCNLWPLSQQQLFYNNNRDRIIVAERLDGEIITCFNSDFVFSPAPYQAPVAVTEAIAAVHTILLIFCCCADADISSPLDHNSFQPIARIDVEKPFFFLLMNVE